MLMFGESVIQAGMTLEDGGVIVELSLINRNCPASSICAGNPAHDGKERKRDRLGLAQMFMGSTSRLA